ncbi:hypothetical protein LCGC14_0445280 [marine sediment metagenome]|uniref:Uncharacterized protein n=1 Tax=marine sediment metagenome TaxID=412755 RepID=A0A0F9V697_9ZZZZ
MFSRAYRWVVRFWPWRQDPLAEALPAILEAGRPLRHYEGTWQSEDDEPDDGYRSLRDMEFIVYPAQWAERKLSAKEREFWGDGC